MFGIKKLQKQIDELRDEILVLKHKQEFHYGDSVNIRATELAFQDIKTHCDNLKYVSKIGKVIKVQIIPDRLFCHEDVMVDFNGDIVNFYGSMLRKII